MFQDRPAKRFAGVAIGLERRHRVPQLAYALDEFIDHRAAPFHR